MRRKHISKKKVRDSSSTQQQKILQKTSVQNQDAVESECKLIKRRKLKMKEYIIIAVKDRVAEKFLQPTFTENVATAKRLFAIQISKIELWKENPEQFELYQLGMFCEDTGNIVGMDENPEKLSNYSP